MDPLSIPALTIAVLDQLWRIGQGTAELISTFRAYDKDTVDLENKVRDENNRIRSLRRLLFDPSPIYNGRTMFEQFDIDVQNQIQIFFEQARGVIDEGFQLLNRRRGKSENGTESAASSSTTLAIPPGETSSRSSSTENLLKAVSVHRWRWTLTDKKRVEVIIRNFGDLNTRIHENIKLWCLGSSIGIDLQHLQHLGDDDDSKALGFDLDAKLHMVASRAQPISKTLEIDDRAVRQDLTRMVGSQDRVGVIHRDGRPILVEHRSYNPDSPVPIELDSRSKDLVETLASLLHQPKELLFRTPSCIGWARQVSSNKVSFMFNVPEGVEPTPISLLDVLTPPASSSSSRPTPSLGQRFHLAHGLARSISQLQLVKWVHESFRSENIIFFPELDAEEKGSPAIDRLDLAEPWVFGFEFSRPEAYFSHGRGDFDPARDIYRHPHRQQNPTQPFNKLHDIYALGVVLLEIGLWQPAMSFEKNGFSYVKDPTAVQGRLIKIAEKKLAPKVGEKYRNVVLRCLQGDFDVKDDTKEDLKLQLAFRSNVVDVLEKIANAI